MEEIKHSHHRVIPATRYGHGDPNKWIVQMERYFRDKATPPEHQLFVASFTLDRPALTYYLEFAKICSSHTWLSFINYLTTRVGKSFDINSEANNQGDLVGTPSSSFKERSQEPSTRPLPMTHQELHQGSALAVVPRVSAFQPTTVNTITTPFQLFEDERLATVQRLQDERQILLHEFLSPVADMVSPPSMELIFAPVVLDNFDKSKCLATIRNEEYDITMPSSTIMCDDNNVNKDRTIILDETNSDHYDPESWATLTLPEVELSKTDITQADQEPKQACYIYPLSVLVSGQIFLRIDYLTILRTKIMYIFIFDPGGCTISSSFRHFSTIADARDADIILTKHVIWIFDSGGIMFFFITDQSWPPPNHYSTTSSACIPPLAMFFWRRSSSLAKRQMSRNSSITGYTQKF